MTEVTTPTKRGRLRAKPLHVIPLRAKPLHVKPLHAKLLYTKPPQLTNLQ